MTIFYKSYRIIDGKPKLVITDGNGNIIKNFTKTQMQLAIFDNRKLNKNRKCCKCGSDKTYLSSSGPLWRSHRCDKKNCTGYICYYCDLIPAIQTQMYLNNKRDIKMKGRKCCECESYESNLWFNHSCTKEYCSKYLCVQCYGRNYKRNDLNSQNNIIKHMRDWRNGQLSRYSPTGKGLIGVYIVCKFLVTEDNNIMYGNFNFYIDTNHAKFGYTEVKTSSINVINGKWSFGNIKKPFVDTLFLVCMDEYTPWKRVEKVYIIPYQEIIGMSSIGIYRNPRFSNGPFKYDKYIVDEKPFNIIYQSLDIYIDPILSKIFRKTEE